MTGAVVRRCFARELWSSFKKASDGQILGKSYQSISSLSYGKTSCYIPQNNQENKTASHLRPFCNSPISGWSTIYIDFGPNTIYIDYGPKYMYQPKV